MASFVQGILLFIQIAQGIFVVALTASLFVLIMTVQEAVKNFNDNTKKLMNDDRTT